MAQNLPIIVYPVRDVEKAKEFYGAFLGVEPYVADEYYVGYKVGDQELGLDPQSTIGPIAYIDVPDINASVKALVAAGGEIAQDATEVTSGFWIAKVKDADGNVVGFRQDS